MARVTSVKKARKAIPSAGIKRGESYFWWKFRWGGKHVSKTYPRRSQLTQSSKKSALFDAEDILSEACADAQKGIITLADLRDSIESAAEEVRNVAEEYRESASSIESAFPNGSPKIDELNERADEVESTADELDQVAQGIEDVEEEDVSALLPKIEGPCAKCHRKRLKEVKKNRGYGGGWQSEGFVPCVCCTKVSAFTSQIAERKSKGRFSHEYETVMVPYVWAKKTIEYDTKPKKGEKHPEWEWEKMEPKEYVRRERASGRIPMPVRSEAEQQAVDSAITEVESVQWNI